MFSARPLYSLLPCTSTLPGLSFTSIHLGKPHRHSMLNELWLEQQRDQLPLWLPVMLGAGIASWFIFPVTDMWVAVLLAGACLAFLGLAFAMKEDAYPRVSFLLDATRGRPVHKWIRGGTDLVVIVVGLYFSFASVNATVKAFSSEAASEILLWPRFYFWIPSALAIVFFTLYALVRFYLLWSPATHSAKE